jgi:hypothetical protein
MPCTQCKPTAEILRWKKGLSSMRSTRSYSELIQLPTFLQRYEYLALRSEVGCETFGSSRWVNQRFYTSKAWRDLRHEIVLRDEGCDLGVPGYEIHSRLIIHHINPLTQEDLEWGTRAALDPDNLICTTHDTHNAIHFGDASKLSRPYVPRSPGDTKLW